MENLTPISTNHFDIMIYFYMLRKAGFHEDECEKFKDKAVGVLDDCRDHFGEGYEFEYSVGRRFGRIELKVRIPGERFSPFEEGKGAKQRSVEKVLCRQAKQKSQRCQRLAEEY